RHATTAQRPRMAMKCSDNPCGYHVSTSQRPRMAMKCSDTPCGYQVYTSVRKERIPDLMCGIIGYVGPQGTDVTSILLDGLGKLEYRGYDSAGIAVLTSTGTLELRRRAGKIANLVDSVDNGSRPKQGTLGIGHTRWATHGRPNDTNAHPHPDCTGVLTVVHNGII